MSKPNPVPTLTTEELDALCRLDACTLANGAGCDIPKIAPLPFPIFAANVAVSHAFVEIPQAALQMATDQEMLISVWQSPDFPLEKRQAAVARTQH